MRPSSEILVGLVKLVVGAHPRWIGCAPDPVQRLYFANHSSHIDTLAIWSALPIRLRRQTRPVAAQDYWGRGLRRYIATKALGAVLINRNRDDPAVDPLAPLAEALSRGDSLIIFPEGTRGKESLPGPFKSGLFHLARQFPQVQLIPVYLENLLRSMPKGAIIPIPMTCTVRFGAPMTAIESENKDQFLARARKEVIKLAGSLSQ
jgi:1-acyl-sn-glycerol-3-phosphate acyltransferase